MFLINGEYKCLEPLDVEAALVAEGLPIDIIKDANSLVVRHGPKPNTGYFLLSNEDFQNIKDELLPVLSVKIVNPDTGDEVTFERMTLTSATNILCLNESLNSPVLIKLEDYRYWMNFVLVTGAYNQIATNRDFGEEPDATFYPHMILDTLLNPSFFHDADGIMREAINIFIEQLNDVSPNFFDNKFRHAENENPNNFNDYSGTPFNLFIDRWTVLEVLSKLSEAFRYSFLTRPNGNTFIVATEATWPDSPNKFLGNIDTRPALIPASIATRGQLNSYRHADDHCRNDSRLGGFGELLIIQNNAINCDFVIKVPYVEVFNVDTRGVSAGGMPYGYVHEHIAAVQETLNAVAKRYLSLLKGSQRRMACKGYVNLHDSISFGLDEVRYVNRGKGIISIAIGKSIDQQDLNYINPESPPDYHIHPEGIQLYRFTLKEDWAENQTAVGDILRHDGTDTGFDYLIKDPFSILEDLGIGDSGWCIKMCGNYYGIQAPCYDPSNPPPDPIPEPD